MTNAGKRSWNEWFGIRFRFHPLFSILLLLSLLMGYGAEIITLFGIVLIHELGHVAVARTLGWQVREVQLLPFGGVAVVEEKGGSPAWEEGVVALAGPLQNLWMIAVGQALIAAEAVPAAWGLYFIQANIGIAMFNLLPIIPLDGGKLLQALAGCWLPYQKALQVTVSISLLLSLGVIAWAFARLATQEGGIQLNGLLIGCFLLYSNWHEFKSMPYRFMRFLVHREQRLQRHTRNGTQAIPILAHGSRRAADIVRLFQRDRSHLIYVLDDAGQIRQVLSERVVLDCFFDEAKRGRSLSELFI